jgi:hypothetical protein
LPIVAVGPSPLALEFTTQLATLEPPPPEHPGSRGNRCDRLGCPASRTLTDPRPERDWHGRRSDTFNISLVKLVLGNHVPRWQAAKVARQ